MDPERWPSLEWPPEPTRFDIVDQVLKVGHPELVAQAKTWAGLEQSWSDFQARPKEMTGQWATRILLVQDRLLVKRWSTVEDVQAGSGLRTRHVQGALAWLLERDAVQVRGNPREYRIR